MLDLVYFIIKILYTELLVDIVLHLETFIAGQACGK